jgi:hypothetical protein
MTRYNTNKVTFAALATMAVALSVAKLVSSVAAPVEVKIRLACELLLNTNHQDSSQNK